MNDRELLELAARAAGLDAWWSDHDGFNCMLLRSDGNRQWNPLKNDGDALRLAVKLHIEFQSYAESGKVYAHSKELLGYGLEGTPSYQAHPYMTEEFGDDPYAATRRAITRAAAEIARAADAGGKEGVDD